MLCDKLIRRNLSAQCYRDFGFFLAKYSYKHSKFAEETLNLKSINNIFVE